ncbi:hypothetical protein MSAN_01020200 [Mycena sanguinolenta]|uniref:F-box domain-containing protein n=1 Tax=Mycena sanguinolenta TaxID=230812 RepID=A0A8H6YRS4_9AGAR|nr:hypothetical protein MSAN_01020200 [Mycena sanguinolenta]
MLDKLPAEICAHIFDFACTDLGRTGRSLSLVSRYIHQTSELARYTRIALVGRAQILSFAEFVGHTDIQVKTRHLLINAQESEEQWQSRVFHVNAQARKAQSKYTELAKFLPYNDEKLKEAEDEMAREYAAANAVLGEEGTRPVECILRALGPTLEILDIALNERVAKMLLQPISLPRLVDLTTRCDFPLRPNDVPALEPTHSLRFLHIVHTTNQWHCVERFFKNGISYFAPSLTHLRLSEIHEDAKVISYLECGLGHSNEPPSRLCRLPPAILSQITLLPPTIERVLLKPATEPNDECCCDDCCYCHEVWEYRNIMNHGRLLRDKDDRVLLLKEDSTPPAEDPYFREWLDKVKGAVCDWDTLTSDLDLDSFKRWWYYS